MLQNPARLIVRALLSRPHLLAGSSVYEDGDGEPANEGDAEPKPVEPRAGLMVSDGHASPFPRRSVTSTPSAAAMRSRVTRRGECAPMMMFLRPP